ncbi:hypothetical protein M467_05080 [Exiguobacterium chiriqhucha RW-2]|uniref:Topology modulation protein n=1 Tax=Exiguobacterium chiriqhucha RW-2 TaxID=1345023 RepID=U1LVK9_9BACL|nr:hypothetical protein M467_05080 [Exiguobacterium chiriqhucha RW-2]
MQKILLIGSGGSGKSTLARELGARLGIDVHHLDALLWKPNWTPATRQEQIATQSALIERDSWIIDGNYGGTLDLRVDAADTIVFLDLPRTVCTYRVLKRMLKYRGKTRPDMGPGCEERFDPKFLKWVRSRSDQPFYNVYTNLNPKKTLFSCVHGPRSVVS